MRGAEGEGEAGRAARIEGKRGHKSLPRPAERVEVQHDDSRNEASKQRRLLAVGREAADALLEKSRNSGVTTAATVWLAGSAGDASQ